jgi:hypothetical protein
MDYSAAVRNYGNIVTRVGTGPILERSADGRGHFLTSTFFSQISEINQVFGTVSKAWPLSVVRFNSPRHRQIDFIHCRMANKNCALDISDILVLKEKGQKYVLSLWDSLKCQNLCCGSYTVFWHTLNSYRMSFLLPSLPTIPGRKTVFTWVVGNAMTHTHHRCIRDFRSTLFTVSTKLEIWLCV